MPEVSGVPKIPSKKSNVLSNVANLAEKVGITSRGLGSFLSLLRTGHTRLQVEEHVTLAVVEREGLVAGAVDFPDLETAASWVFRMVSSAVV